eukprot:scaffold618999_cov45-Prasinocladus_malaysianus.AAC.1
MQWTTGPLRTSSRARGQSAPQLTEEQRRLIDQEGDWLTGDEDEDDGLEDAPLASKRNKRPREQSFTGARE